MKLVIVESPNKTKTISQFLGSDYKVMASVGHIRDLATTGKGGLGVDVDNGFKPTYAILPNKYKVVNELKSAVKKADEVYIATDPDREGEAIAWHLAQVLGLDVNTANRLSFNAITKRSVLEAMDKPSHIDMDLVASQETRRIVDRIIGFKLSTLLQKKIHARSAGRVQSVTLKMIVERQREIDAFIPKEYWDISGIFGESKVAADLYSKDDVIYKPYSIDSEEKYKQILKELPKMFKAQPLTFSKRTNASRPAFTTSTLEQEAFSQFKYPARLTASLAQKLFEGIEVEPGEYKALITYIRTDSTRLAPEFVELAGQYINSHFGPGFYSGTASSAKKSELIQDAHEAIRPIDLAFTPAMADKKLPSNMANLYRLIYTRSIASLMTPREDEACIVKLEGNGYVFKTEAVHNKFKGFSAVYDEQGLTSGPAVKELPEELINAAKEGKEVEAKEIKGEGKKTQPPYKYNDGTVIKLMEEKGIGRPSTYSSTISTLMERSYVEEEKKSLIPTDKGELAVERLDEFFPDIMDYGYTKDMEDSLDKVKDGDTSKVKLLKDFYDRFVKEYDKAVSDMEQPPAKEVGTCPVCGSPLVEKEGRYGKFIACSNFPKCHYIQKKQPTVEYVEGRVCPNCGGKLVYRESRKGRFIGCSNFPKCKYTENIAADGQVNPATSVKPAVNEEEDKDHLVGTECPKCHKGHLVIKKSRFGTFYGCSNFPKCRYIQKMGGKKEE